MPNKKNKPQGRRPQQPSRRVQQRRAQELIPRNPKPKNTYWGDVGSNLGALAGNVVSKIFGLGAYKLKQNSIMENIIDTGVPVMHSGNESIIFRHREYIADVSSSNTFTVNTYDINPGLGDTFPYLTSIAQNFQEYQFRGLVFEFKSTSADALNSTNTALGTVMLAAQYRADAPDFLNKQQVMNEMWSVDCKPSHNILLPIECKPSENPLPIQYVRTGPVPSGQDAKLYDLAKLTVATVGSQAAAVVGELWATYEIELRKPQIIPRVGYENLGAHYVGTTAIGTAHYWGTDQTARFDTIGLTVGNTNIKFPTGSIGYFMVQYFVAGSSTAITIPTVTPTNCAISTFVFNNTGSASNTGTTSTIMEQCYVVYISDVSVQANLAYTSGTFVTSPTFVDLWVTQLPYPAS